jgi:group I intron endonuclease
MNDTDENSNRECEAIGNIPIKNERRLSNDTTIKKQVGIYGLRCRTTDKWCVGQSVDINHRWNDYRLLRCKNQSKLYRALVKYGYDNFDKVIIESCDGVQWIIDYREMYWIKLLNCIANGYNLTEGGNGGKKSQETREKMSRSRMGIVYSEETRKRMSLGQQTPKQLAFVRSLSEKRRGKPLTKEHREKIGKKQFGENNHFYGKSHLEAAKKIISEKAKSRNTGGENNPFFGRVHSEETKKKMSYAHRNISDETRAKLSEKAKLREQLKKLRIGLEVAATL